MLCQKEFVTLVIQSNALMLYWLQQPKKNSGMFFPKAWAMHSLDYLQAEKPIIFNLTFFQKVIADFLQKNKIHNAFIAVGVSGTILWEQCSWVKFDEQPSIKNFFSQPNTLIWDYIFLQRNEYSHEQLFYLFGIVREVLFQYQLLALSVPFNCAVITSGNFALLYALSMIAQKPLQSHQGAFDNPERITTYCLDFFEQHGYQKLFGDDSVQFYDFYKQQKEAILTAVGLFLLGKNNAFR